MTHLFRVVPFHRLKQIADQEALAFVTYRLFKDDPHEAPLIQALTTSDGVKDVFKVLQEHGEGPTSLPALILAARKASASAYMQCWTKTEEHNLMWDDYGDGPNAVRMRMTQAGQNNLPCWISFHEARYESKLDLWKELELVTPQLGTTLTTETSGRPGRKSLLEGGVIDFTPSLTFKLKAYHHENEVRLMTPIYNDLGMPMKAAQSAPWFNNSSGNPDLTLVQIGAIRNVISSVMAGPKANDDHQRAVEAFCVKHGLKYEGKSLLRTSRYTGSKKIFTSDPDDLAKLS